MSFIKTSVALVASIVLLAIAAPLKAQQPEIRATRIVKIGHAGPLSGPIGHLGLDTERGARLAIEELNASEIVIDDVVLRFELISEDDAANPDRAASVALRLVGQGVSAVVGHLTSGTTRVATPLYASARIPSLTPSASNPRLTHAGHNAFFRLIANDYQVAWAVAHAARRNLGIRSAIALDDGTAYGIGISDEFSTRFHTLTGKVHKLGDDLMTLTPKNLDSVVAAIARLQPDAVFFGGMDTQASVLLERLRATGLQTTLLGADGICTLDMTRSPAIREQGGLVFCGEPGNAPEATTPELRSFGQRFQQRFGQRYQVYAPNSYDAVKVVAAAMVRARSTDPAKFASEISEMAHEGVTGRIDFTIIGDMVAPVVTIQAIKPQRRQVYTEIRLPR